MYGSLLRVPWNLCFYALARSRNKCNKGYSLPKCSGVRSGAPEVGCPVIQRHCGGGIMSSGITKASGTQEHKIF